MKILFQSSVRSQLRLSILLMAVGVAACAQAQWIVQNLHPAGALDSRALGVGDGQVVGSATYQYGPYNSRNYAHLWTSTTADSVVNLHSGSLDSYSEAQAAANGRQGGMLHGQPGIWSGTPGSFASLRPYAASSAYIYAMHGDYQCGQSTIDGVVRAGFWNGLPSTWIDLHPVGYYASTATGIWGAQQTGVVWLNGTSESRACLWQSTPESLVILHPAGAAQSWSSGVSNGQQAGYVIMPGQEPHAALWQGTPASWVDLNPAGAQFSDARAVGGDQQVGFAYVNGAYRASLWSGSAASWVDLHQLVSGFASTYASGIWREGTDTYVSGIGQRPNNGRDEALLWIRPGPNSFVFTLNKAKVAGQNSTQGTITMGSTKATSTVFTTYDNSSLVTTPATVTVPAGQFAKSFQITNVPSTVNWPIVITAKLGSLTRSRTLTLVPLIPTALAFLSNPMQGGNSTLVNVVINGVAGPNGLKLGISDDSPLTQVPPTITIPAGASSGMFTITSSPVSSQVLVKVTAKNSAGQQSATLRLVP